jgi:CO dehydrogenase/acetyl-CoA synthase delta subunit
MTGARRLAMPRHARVVTDADGQPFTVDGQAVDGIRETWLLEDRWWTEQPLRRRYWEVVTTSGSDQVVFHDLIAGAWWRQR